MCDGSVTTIKKINANRAITLNKMELETAKAGYGDTIQVTFRVIKKH